MTLTPFSRSHKDLGQFSSYFQQSITWRNKWILAIHSHLNCWDMQKNWLDLGDLDPLFKVTWWLRWFEKGLSEPYLLNEWMDFYHTCTSILLAHWKELIRFWWPWFHCKVTEGLGWFEIGFSAPYLQKEMMKLDQTCTSILLRQGQELIRFW